MAEQESCAGANHTKFDMQREVECTHCFPQYSEHGEINPLPSGVVPKDRGSFQRVDWCAQNDHAHFDVDRGTIKYLCAEDQTCTIDKWEEVECNALAGNWRNGCDDDNWSNCPDETQLSQWGTSFYGRDWSDQDGGHMCKCTTVGYKTEYTTERACIEDWQSDPYEPCSFDGGVQKPVKFAVSDSERIYYEGETVDDAEPVSYYQGDSSGQFSYDVESTTGVPGASPGPSSSTAPSQVTLTAENMPAILDAPKPRHFNVPAGIKLNRVVSHTVKSSKGKVKITKAAPAEISLDDIPMASNLEQIVKQYCSPWHYGCENAAKQKYHELVSR